MSRRSRSFGLVTVVSSLLIPGALLVLRPFGEERTLLCVLVGWGLALAAVVPSFMALSRVVASDDRHRFQRVFMGTMLGRFVLCIVGVSAFALTVPALTVQLMIVFLISFFLGFAVLSTAELMALLSKSPDGNHA